MGGKIPSEIGDLDALIKLKIQDNSLKGKVPEAICNLKITNNGSYWFNLENNSLCPPYPECLENAVGNQNKSDCN